MALLVMETVIINAAVIIIRVFNGIFIRIVDDKST